MKRGFSHIPYGFRTVYGFVMSDRAVDAYNNLQDRMGRYAEEGREVPEELLNGSHNLMSAGAFS